MCRQLQAERKVLLRVAELDSSAAADLEGERSNGIAAVQLVVLCRVSLHSRTQNERAENAMWTLLQDAVAPVHVALMP